MKNILTLVMALCTLSFASAQIPNPNFKNWTEHTQDIPEQWEIIGHTEQVSPGASGSYAVKIQKSSQSGENEPGVVLYGQPEGEDFKGGTPFSARPDSMVGYFKYDIASGDSAWVLMIFKKNGQPISMDLYKLTGSHTSGFKRMAFKINYMSSLTPDTLFIGFTSTNPEENSNPASYVIVDNISFTGTSQNVPNPDFENWDQLTYHTLDGWYYRQRASKVIERTDDAVSGNYALRLNTTIGPGDTARGEIQTMPKDPEDHNWAPSFPVGSRPDSIIFYAKYFPSATDTGMVSINLFSNGMQVGNGQGKVSGTVSSYKRITGPVTYFGGFTGVPDSAMIYISTYALSYSGAHPRGNATLYVDKLSFDWSTTDLTGCAGQLVRFTHPTRFKGDSIESYTWDFGDGSSTSSLQNPTHTYMAAGIYEVTLAAETDQGETDYSSRIVEVFESPGAGFTAVSHACTGDTVYFEAQDTASANVSYVWQFGDGITGTGKSTWHVYTVGGTYNPGLIVTNTHGCLTSHSEQISVHQVQAGFSFTDECEGTEVHFFNNTSVTNDTINSYQWDFGDGNTSSVEDPVHVYTNPGKYPVRIIGITANGCTDTAYDTIEVFAAPKAHFSTAAICEGPVEYSDSSTGNITSWLWKFGDGNSSTDRNPTHTFPGAGSYDVTLIVETAEGCVDSVTVTQTLYPIPDASFTHITTHLTLHATANDTGLVQYEWDFGDGQTVTISSPGAASHTYTAAGTYIVKLKATSSHGCHSTFIDTIKVDPSGIEDDFRDLIGLRVYPNPFRESTVVEYTLAGASRVQAVLYALDGRQISILQDAAQPAGLHTLTVSSAGHRLAPGEYIIGIRVNGKEANRKILKVE